MQRKLWSLPATLALTTAALLTWRRSTLTTPTCFVHINSHHSRLASYAQDEEEVQQQEQSDSGQVVDNFAGVDRELLSEVNWENVKQSFMEKRNLTMKDLRLAKKNPNCEWCMSVCGDFYIQAFVMSRLEKRYPELFTSEEAKALEHWYTLQSEICIASRNIPTFDMESSKLKPNLTDEQLQHWKQVQGGEDILPSYLGQEDTEYWEAKLIQAFLKSAEAFQKDKQKEQDPEKQ